MKSCSIRIGRWLTSVLWLLPLASFNVHALELTPLYGSQGGGNLTHIATDSSVTLRDNTMQGFILGWAISDQQEMELFYSQQHTRLDGDSSLLPAEDLIDLDIRTMQLGGTVLLDEGEKVNGFLSGGLGFTQFSPADGTTVTRPSASLGLGIRWMPTERVGLRLEARVNGALFNSDTTVFCSGGCSFTLSGDMLSQYMAYAGVVVRLD